jgi:predicted oxidoreductase (fatty acid repression mutant protein)
VSDKPSHLEYAVLDATKEAIEKAITAALSAYNGPLHKMVEVVVNENRDRLLEITRQAFTDTISTDEFRTAVQSAFVHKLARFLVAKVEGSVEKAANTMLADPVSRARMVLAVKSVIDGGAA